MRRKAVTIVELVGIALFLIGAGFVYANRISVEQARKASRLEVQGNLAREKQVAQQSNPHEFSGKFQRMFDSLDAARHKRLPREGNFSFREQRMLDSAMRIEAQLLQSGNSSKNAGSTHWQAESIERIHPPSTTKTPNGKRN